MNRDNVSYPVLGLKVGVVLPFFFLPCEGLDAGTNEVLKSRTVANGRIQGSWVKEIHRPTGKVTVD